MPFSLEVTGSNQQMVVNGAVAMSVNDRKLAVQLHESANPIESGSDFTYVVHYANEDDAPMSQKLLLSLPPSVEFINATDGGDLNSEGLVEWPVTSIPAFDGGTRTAVVRAHANENPPGSQLRAVAEVITMNGTTESAGQRARATAQTQVGSSPLDPPLLFTLSTPSTATRNEQIIVEATLTNTGATPIFDVSARVWLPEGLNWFYTNTLSHPAKCPRTDTSCYSGEFVVFDELNLNGSESVTFTISPIITNGVEFGELVTFLGHVVIDDGPLPRPHSAATVRIVQP